MFRSVVASFILGATATCPSWGQNAGFDLFSDKNPYVFSYVSPEGQFIGLRNTGDSQYVGDLIEFDDGKIVGVSDIVASVGKGKMDFTIEGSSYSFDRALNRDGNTVWSPDVAINVGGGPSELLGITNRRDSSADSSLERWNGDARKLVVAKDFLGSLKSFPDASFDGATVDLVVPRTTGAAIVAALGSLGDGNVGLSSTYSMRTFTSESLSVDIGSSELVMISVPVVDAEAIIGSFGNAYAVASITGFTQSKFSKPPEFKAQGDTPYHRFIDHDGGLKAINDEFNKRLSGATALRSCQTDRDTDTDADPYRNGITTCEVNSRDFDQTDDFCMKAGLYFVIVQTIDPSILNVNYSVYSEAVAGECEINPTKKFFPVTPSSDQARLEVQEKAISTIIRMTSLKP